MENGPGTCDWAPPVGDVVHEAAVLLVVNEALRGPCESGTVGIEPLPTYDRRSERVGDDLEPEELWHRRGEVERNLPRYIVHGHRIVDVAEGEVRALETGQQILGLDPAAGPRRAEDEQHRSGEGIDRKSVV